MTSLGAKVFSLQALLLLVVYDADGDDDDNDVSNCIKWVKVVYLYTYYGGGSFRAMLWSYFLQPLDVLALKESVKGKNN